MPCRSGFRSRGRRAGRPTSCPSTSSRSAIDHIAHLPDDELPGDTFHLVDPEPMSVGGAINTFAKAAHAPQFAMRIDPNLTNAIPKPVRAGLMALPTVKRIRNQLLRDLGIPPDAMANRDFFCHFDARDTQRALEGTGIAVPPLDTYAAWLWDYWERNLDPDLFRDRSLASAINDKKVLITGASSGIGLETALKVGEAGGTVLLVSRTREKLEEVARRVEDAGGTAHVHPADLSDLEDIDRLAQEVLDPARRHRRAREQRRALDPPERGALLRPLPRLRAHDAAQLLRRAQADLGLPARHARAQVGPHHQRVVDRRADEHPAILGVRGVEVGARRLHPLRRPRVPGRQREVHDRSTCLSCARR